MYIYIYVGTCYDWPKCGPGLAQCGPGLTKCGSGLAQAIAEKADDWPKPVKVARIDLLASGCDISDNLRQA